MIYDPSVMLGRGRFGIVYSGSYSENEAGGQVTAAAVKRVPSMNIQRGQREEIYLRHLSHPNIVKLYDVLDDENFRYKIICFHNTSSSILIYDYYTL